MLFSSRRFVGYLVVPLFVSAGCTSYRAQPLDPSSEWAAFTQRDLTTALTESGNQKSSISKNGFTEADVVAIALRLNPDLAVSRIQRGFSDAVLIDAGLWPNPELGMALRGGAPGFTADIDLLAALLRPGERHAREASATAGQRAAYAECARDEWQIVTAVRLAYVDILTTQLRLLSEQDMAALSEKAAEALERQRSLGEATDLAVATALADAGHAQRRVREVAATLAKHRQTLNHLIGLPVTLTLPLAENGKPLAALNTTAVIPENINAETLAGRWEITAARAQYERAEHELQLAIGKQYPALRIGPSAAHDGDGTSFGAAIALELPIFDRNQGGIRAAETQRNKARADYQATLQHLLAEVEAAIIQLRVAADEIVALDTSLIPAAKKAADFADQALQAHDIQLTDYLAVRRLWFDAQRARLDAVAESHVAKIKLDAALGRGAYAQTQPTPSPIPSAPLNAETTQQGHTP